MSSRSLNKVMLIGNLTRDPDFRVTANDTPLCTFTIATNRGWKDSSGEFKESTQFHNIAAWGKLAEICRDLLKKGEKVYVEGALITRSWEAEDGSKKYKTEVRIEEMIVLGSRSSAGAADGSDDSAGDDNDGDDDENTGEQGGDVVKSGASEEDPQDDAEEL